MADPNTRQGKRTPVTLKIKFKSETLEQFIERYAVDVSQGGIFIRTKEPLAVGTQMKFEFQLRDASPLIAGEGTVVWTRENDPSRPAIAPGMGVRFDRLGEGSQTVLEKILAEKAKQAPQRGGSTDGSTKPPLFTDVPTRVAPAPVQDALLGQRSGRTRQDSQETPLPKPVPFHSDADEFGAEAFEEATKVRALDELVAQTADDGGGDGASVDELAARRGVRAETPLAEPPVDDRLRTVPDRDSAPGLPSPPEMANPGNTGRTGKLLDTSPSPRSATPSSGPPLRPSQPNLPAVGDLSGKTRLGLEPAKAQTTPPYQPPPQQDRQAVPRAVAAEQSHPAAPKRPSAAPIIIGILVVVAAAMAGVWYFVLREKVEEGNGTQKPVGSGGSALAVGSGSAGSAAMSGSNGSAVAMVGSNGSAGSAAVAPKGPTVDTVIASNIAKSTVTVEDDDQTGPAPFTAKLEKDKVYKVRVEAPGYLKVELDVKGGQDKVTAKLAPKPHVLSVSSDPPGATIIIDGAPTGKVTPFDVELTAAQAAKPKLRVTLRKGGFRQVDQMFDAGNFKDEDTKATGEISAKMAVQVIYTPPPNNNNHPPNNTGSGAGSGSATPANAGSGAGSSTTPPDHNGSGSTEPKPPENTGSGAGGGGSTTPSGGGAGGGGAGGGGAGGGGAGGTGAGATGAAKTSTDPEPDFAKSK